MSQVAGSPGSPKELFARAALEIRALLALSPKERAARVDELEQRDPPLGQEVRSLLQHGFSDSSVLNTPVVMSPEGMLVGRYLIVSRIGEGGMGTVFLAEQVEPVRREVALKLIKLGMDSRAIVRRFEAERQTLARMEHPGIARILDGGVASDGRPYFVMELVRGVPITAWCDAQHLDAPARIALFLDVCAAVQHAHQKGIIHRDLKPNNLLVTEVDGRPMPKVIDFGIARALDDDGALDGTVTKLQPAAGTPEYMSPEQAGPASADGCDTRSDVYSLGVVLYELLTGTTPTRARTRSGNTRRPGSIRPRLRGDLDAIILKAVEHEPHRRYPTVAALADDLRRHLNHQPVLARPAGLLYVSTQFARRHTLALTAAAVVLLSLVVGLALALSGWQHARQELFVSTIGRGRLAGVAGDMAEARNLLWRCHLEQPDSPQASWALREFYFQHPCLWTKQEAAIRACQIRVLDANTLIMANSESAPYTVNLETGETTRKFDAVEPDGARHIAHTMDLAPDGSVVAIGDRAGDVRLWSVKSGAYLGSLVNHGEGHTSVRFLSDSKSVLTAGADGHILLVHLDDPKNAQLQFHADAIVRTLAVHHPTGQLAAGLGDGSVLYWKDLHATPSRERSHSEFVMCMEFNSAGDLLASGSTDQTTVVWSIARNERVLKLNSNDGTVRDLSFAADGTLYILGWWRLERLRSGAATTELVLAEGGWRMAMPRPNEVVVSHAEEHAVRRWRIDAHALAQPVHAEPGWKVRAVIGGSAPLIMYNGAALQARTFDGAALWTHRFPARVSAVGASDDGSCLAVGIADKTLWLRRNLGAEWEQIASDFAPGSNDVVAVNAAGTRVAYPTKGNAIALVTLGGAAAATAPIIRQALPESPHQQLAVHLSSDGKTLMASERRGLLRVLDMQSGQQWSHQCAATIFAVDTGKDGTMLLGAWTGPVMLAHARTGVTAELRGHTALVGCVAAHPVDPDLVLTGSMDGTVRLWHLGLQCELQSLAPFGGMPIEFVAFDAGGARVVASDSNGHSASWPLYVADRLIKDNYPRPQAAGPDLRHQQSRLD